MDLNTTSIILNATLNQPSQTLLKDWLPLIIFAFTAFLSLLVWGFSEWAKRSNERFLQKEERYLKLIELIENLKENEKPGDPDLKIRFIHQINLCWLYCSDDVVRKTINLISKFNDDRVPKEEKEKTVSELMISLRKDVLKIMPWNIRPTKLNQADYEKINSSMLRRFVFKTESGKFKLELGDIDPNKVPKAVQMDRATDVILKEDRDSYKVPRTVLKK
jgi:hypothetical protein